MMSIQTKTDLKGQDPHFHRHPWSVETHTSISVVNQRNQDLRAIEALLGYPAQIVEANLNQDDELCFDQRIYLSM